MLCIEAVTDLDAVGHDVSILAASTSADVMAAVKPDAAYGHGLVPSTRVALVRRRDLVGYGDAGRGNGPTAVGVAAPALGLAVDIRESDALRQAIAADIDRSVSNPWQLDAVRAIGRNAWVRLKIVAVFGLSPVPGTGFDLVPAMTLRAQVASVERASALLNTLILPRWFLARLPESGRACVADLRRHAPPRFPGQLPSSLSWQAPPGGHYAASIRPGIA